MTKRGVDFIAAAMLCHASAVGAQVADTPNLSFNGFGTAGVAYSDEDQADFVSNILVADGVGRTRQVSPEVDSRLGLQATANFTPKLSGVVQFVIEQRDDDNYTPTLEWANLKYEITPDLYVRAGRIVLPGVMASEYRKVGYALPWVRPPLEVYSLVPVTNSDGVDAGYEFYIGEFTNMVRFNYGRLDIDLPDGSKSKARDLWGLTGTAQRRALALHLSYLRSRITVESFQPLFSAFRQFGPQGQAIADRFGFDDETVEFIGVGASYDPGDWFVRGELARLESRTVIGDRYGWYVTGGYRFDSVTPYVTLASIQVDAAASDPGLTVTGLPPPLAARANRLNAALNEALGSGPEQKSIALGARWDFARNVALKTQFDYLDLDAGSPGVLVNEQPGFRRGGTALLFSVTLDFVF